MIGIMLPRRFLILQFVFVTIIVVYNILPCQSFSQQKQKQQQQRWIRNVSNRKSFIDNGVLLCLAATNDDDDNNTAASVSDSQHSSSSSSSQSQSQSRAPPKPYVLCVGETLYDCLPEAIFLGGATTNVGVHLASMGIPTAVVTCLGDDQLGNEAIRRLQVKGVNTDYIQKHPNLGTGMVTAIIDRNGDADYTFDTPSSWDMIELDQGIRKLVDADENNNNNSNNVDEDSSSSSVQVTVIGTIASRLGSREGATSAATISKIRNLAKDDTVVMDVNLRPPWYDPESVLELSRGASSGKKLALVKLNEEELPIVEEWCGIHDDDSNALVGDKLKQRMVALGESLNARRVCVTRGGDGAAIWCQNGDDREEFFEHKGYECDAESGFDTVGAGDSFLAALIRSLFLEKEAADKALDRACALGGYVAKRRGACPDHSLAPENLRDKFASER